MSAHRLFEPTSGVGGLQTEASAHLDARKNNHQAGAGAVLAAAHVLTPDANNGSGRAWTVSESATVRTAGELGPRNEVNACGRPSLTRAGDLVIPQL